MPFHHLKYVLIILKLLFLSLISLNAVAKTVKTPLWEVIDLPFSAKEPIDKPFEISFDAKFTHAKSGQTMTIPAFYNGGNEWIVRFSASTTGLWKYQTSSQLTSLDQLRGNIKVGPNKDPNNHGGITLNKANPQHFYYEDGTPFFLLGFELDWLFALDYHNDKGTPKSEHLLNLLKTNGYNQLVMNVYAHDVSWKKDQKLKQHPEHEFGGLQSIFPFLGTNSQPDHSSLNVDFFKKLDRTIQLMHDKRIVSHLMIYVWNKKVSWPEMNSEADNRYFDYVIKRYQAYPNIIWDISKEALYYGKASERYVLDRIERLHTLDRYNRLITVHDYVFCSRHPEKVDFISTQNWRPNIYNMMLEASNKFKNKPVYNIEHGGYDESPYHVFPGAYTDPEINLRRNYLNLFAGTYTTHYWQGAAWNVIIYNPFEQPDNFIKPKFSYFKHMADFFKKYPFHQFKPAPKLGGSGYALKSANETFLFYTPKENYQLTANHLKNKNGPKRNYQWFNTLTGEYSEIAEIKPSTTFISPWRGDADTVLISHAIKPQ